MAILELVREGLIDIVQQEPFAPLHVRSAAAARRLRVVADNSAAEDAVEVEVIAGTEAVAFDDGFDDADDDEDEDVGADPQ
jgi:hypothetical protein